MKIADLQAHGTSQGLFIHVYYFSLPRNIVESNVYHAYLSLRCRGAKLSNNTNTQLMYRCKYLLKCSAQANVLSYCPPSAYVLKIHYLQMELQTENV